LKWEKVTCCFEIFLILPFSYGLNWKDDKYGVKIISLCINEKVRITFLLGELHAFFDYYLVLFDFFYQPGVKDLCPGLNH